MSSVLFGWVTGVARAAIFLFVFSRCGLLGMAATLVTMFALIEVPLTLDWSAWYAPRALPVVLPLLGLAGYAFHAALGGKPLFGRLDD